MNSLNDFEKTAKNKFILIESERHEYFIGGTHFFITSHYKPDAKESLTDKISRMIRNDALKNKALS